MNGRIQFFESGQALAGARLGIVPLSALIKYDMYKRYTDRRDQMITIGKSKKQIWMELGAIKREVSKECKYHYSNVTRAIFFFEEDSLQKTENGECQNSNKSELHL